MAVREPKSAPEDDKQLVEKSTTWNGLRGLHNLGNTCYFNSIVQNLIQTIPLRTHLVPRDPLQPTEVKNHPKGKEESLSSALRSTFVQMWLGTGRTFDPHTLFSAIGGKVPRFNRRTQQDSHELLRYLMDEVDTEILTSLKKFKRQFLGKTNAEIMAIIEASKQPNGPNTASKENSASSSEPAPAAAAPVVPQGINMGSLDFFVRRQAGNLVPNESWNISDYEKDVKSGLITYMEAIFGGRIESTLMCHSCGSTSATYETFMDLSLPIPVRFLDEKMKRVLGYIPTPKSAPQASKKASAQRRQEEEASKGEEEEDEKIEFKTDYKNDTESESLATMGLTASKPKIGQLNSQSDSGPSSNRNSKTNVNVAARLSLAAKQQAKLEAAQASIKKPKITATKGKKPVSKRDKQRLKRAADAQANQLDVSTDLDGLTEEQIMELALQDGDGTELVESVAESIAETSISPEVVQKPEETNDTTMATDSEAKAGDSNGNSGSASTDAAAIDSAPNDVSDTTKDATAETSDMAETEVAKEETSLSAPPSIDEPVNPTSPDHIDTKSEVLVTDVPVEPAGTANGNESAITSSAPCESAASPTTESGESQSSSTGQEETNEAKESEIVTTTSTESSNAAVAQGEINSASDPSSEVIQKQESKSATESAETSSRPSLTLSSSGRPSIHQLNPKLRYDGRKTSRPVGLSIEACLYEFTEPEVLSGSNAYGCYECTKKAFLKEGRDIYHLVMEYGSEEEKKAAKQPKSKLLSSSSPMETENESSVAPIAEVSSSVTVNAEKAENPNNSEPAPSNSLTESDSTELTSTSDSTTLSGHTNAATEDTASQTEATPMSSSVPNGADSAADSGSEEDSEEDEPVVVHEKTEDELEVEKAKLAAKAPKVVEHSIPLVKSVATKQILIDEVPQILTLHLKRFWQTLSGSTKIDLKVEFPAVLDIAPYLSRSARKRYGEGEGQERPMKPLNLESVKYQLYGIVVHSGSMGSGHYVAYTRRRESPISDVASLEEITKGWHYFSDTQMSATTLDYVLNQQAYILFYERITE